MARAPTRGEMACNNCGACCNYVALDIRPESVPWMELHGVPLSEDGRGGKQFVLTSPCAWRDEEARRCRDYEHRPQICRDYSCEQARGNVDITRQMIEKRKAELMADLNAISGALQDCDYWLAKLDEGYDIDDLIPGAVVEEVVPVEVTKT